MTEVKFQAAILADAVGRAAKIAPSKGAAYDKAAGLVVEITAMATEAVVRSTNLEVSYREVVPMTAMAPADATWRFSAGLFNGIISGLPREREVSLRQDGTIVHITAGKSKAKVRAADASSFPEFIDFDESVLKPVSDLGKRLKQVSWATDKTNVPFSGVHINGQALIATDRYKMVKVPAEVPVDNPITVPMTLVAPVIPDGEIKLAAVGKRLLLMPSDNVKIYTVIFDAQYPTDAQLAGVMRNDFTVSAVFSRQDFIDALSRMLVLVKSERYPTLKLNIINTGSSAVHLYMNVPDVGEMEDEIEALTTGDFEVYFTPEHLLGALNASRQDRVKLSMGDTELKSVGVFDEDNYSAWVMPRNISGGGET